MHQNVTAGAEFGFDFEFLFKGTKYTGGEEIINKPRYAVEYGPMLFAVMGAPNPVTVKFNPEKPEEWFEPVKQMTPFGASVALKLKGDNHHEYRAYIDIHDEPFDIYPIVEKRIGM